MSLPTVRRRGCGRTSWSTTSRVPRSTRGEARLQSDGSPWRPLVDACDIAAAFVAALEAPGELVHDQAFNVGRDEDVVQIRDIAEQVSARLGAPVTYAPGAAPDKRDYQVDFTKIATVHPNFLPEWTIARGVDELAADMARIGLDVADFEGPRDVRLAKIRELLDSGHLEPAGLRLAGAAR